MISLFLDLSKAFHTVNHQILLNKLKYYGLQQSEYNGFQSYLSNRKKQLHANGVASDTRFIPTGVLQGSILGSCCSLFSLMTFQSLPPFFLLDYMLMIHLQLLLEVILTVYCVKLTIIYQLSTNGYAVIN